MGWGDLKTFAVGLGTALTGGALTLAQIQSIIGIVLSIVTGLAGLALTIATYVWRRREHRRRMRGE